MMIRQEHITSRDQIFSSFAALYQVQVIQEQYGMAVY
jgi:hypothetical protein